MNKDKTGNGSGTSNIYNYEDFNIIDVLPVLSWNVKPYNKTRFLRNIIALDTETTKLNDEILFITDWSFTIEDYGCIYGHRVQDLITLISDLCDALGTSESARILIFVHNFSYDYMFLRNHLIEAYGVPVWSIATKPHKYVCMQFANGIEFRDSYILTGRSLEKFCYDMGSETQKQTGAWDYDKFRTPASGRTDQEKFYACADTIALVQALRIFFHQHKCNPSTVEYTNTGFVRAAGLKASRSDKSWRPKFLKTALDYDVYMLLESAFHGGYTHANRYYISSILHDITSYDFTSSYPARMLYNKFPSGKWIKFTSCTFDDIIDMEDTFAFTGYLFLSEVKLDKDCPMPPIAKHKCKVLSNALVDNGRIISADYLVLPFTDPDLLMIRKYYTWGHCAVSNVYYTNKEYLPDWFCKMIMELFRNKTTEKGKDDVLYMLSKGMLNSLYGMTVQKILRDDIKEDFEDNAWKIDKTKSDREKSEEALTAFYSNRKKFLPYQWGVWVTAYAQQELFKLGELCGNWIYSDTDSVKGTSWDTEGLKDYNDNVRKTAKERGYGTIEYNGKEYTLGVAEFDGNYKEFVTLGSKRYCCRDDTGLHITVAGVPKIGVEELNNDIKNFRQSMVFKNTNKKAASYIYNDGVQQIKINEEVIEYGCSVRLDDVEYTLDQTVQYNKETGLPFSEFNY